MSDKRTRTIFRFCKTYFEVIFPSEVLLFSSCPACSGIPYSHRQVAGGINHLRRLAEDGTGPDVGPVPPSTFGP